MSFKNNKRNVYYTMLHKYGITKNEKDSFSLVTIPEDAQGQVTQEQYTSFLTCNKNTTDPDPVQACTRQDHQLLNNSEQTPNNSFVMTIVEKTETLPESESNTYMNYCVIL